MPQGCISQPVARLFAAGSCAKFLDTTGLVEGSVRVSSGAFMQVELHLENAEPIMAARAGVYELALFAGRPCCRCTLLVEV
jgi:hypothetical protein